MHWKIEKTWVLAAVFVIAAGFAAPATAQFYTGRIDVTLTDTTGGRLPGVNVDITGPVNQSTVSDGQGEAHFLNLPVGTYTVKATLSGFKPYENTAVPGLGTFCRDRQGAGTHPPLCASTAAPGKPG